jgi:starvation-inducible DNA-binding protein
MKAIKKLSSHLQLDEIVDAVRLLSDQLAERMRALHALPDGRSETVSTTTTLPKFPAGQVDTAATCRRVHDDVDAEDPTTADLLHKVIETLGQYAWMVSAETMKPGKLTPAPTSRGQRADG